MNIKGKTALVTGSNRGIGLALVQSLVEQGASKVYAGVRNIECYDKNEVLEHSNVEVVALDVTSEEDLKAFTKLVTCLDIVINNAGVASGSGFLQEQSYSIANNEMAINFLGPLNLIRHLAVVIKRDKTAIINISSIAGISGYAAMGTYSASKAALHSMTQSLRGELKGHQVIGVYPGPTATRMTEGLDIEKALPKEVAERILKALECGEDDVFPDDFSSHCYNEFLVNPKALEQSFSASFMV